MTYYGIKNKKTGEMVREFFMRDPKNNISVLAFDTVPGSMGCHIFLSGNRSVAESVLRDGIYIGDRESYKLDEQLVLMKDDLVIDESEFNLK